MHTGSWTLLKSTAGALGGLALTLLLLPSPASAAGTPTVEPISAFTVTTQQCAGGTQSPLVQYVQWNVIDPLSYPAPGPLITLPTVSLNPGCTPAPPLLSSIINASNTVSSSPSGSATVSSEALGNALLGEAAAASVTFTASIPLSSPASSVEVSIPYTTTGLTMTPGGEAVALVTVGPPNERITCSDGSEGTVAPFNQSGDLLVFPILQDVPPGSGTVSGIRFSCPDGSDLVSGVGFAVSVDTGVNATSGHTESASANFDMHDVTATVDP